PGTPCGRRGSPRGSLTRSLAQSAPGGPGWRKQTGDRRRLHGLRLRLGLRLRPVADDAVLAAVRRVPDVVVEELPARRVDLAVHARRERGRARLVDDLLALVQARIG